MIVAIWAQNMAEIGKRHQNFGTFPFLWSLKIKGRINEYYIIKFNGMVQFTFDYEKMDLRV